MVKLAWRTWFEPHWTFYRFPSSWKYLQVQRNLFYLEELWHPTLAWKIPWTEEPGRLQSMGFLRVGQDWATSLSLFTFMHWKRKWQPTPVFLPGESQGRGNLVGLLSMGSHRVRHDWSDLAAAAAAYLLANKWMNEATNQKSYFCFPQRNFHVNSRAHGIFYFVLILDDPLPLWTCWLLAQHSQSRQKAAVTSRLSTSGASESSC